MEMINFETYHTGSCGGEYILGTVCKANEKTKKKTLEDMLY
jgi:hypothetical protein